MGEIVAANSSSKESSSSTIQCPLLNDTNYTGWTIQMKVALKVHKVFETIDSGEDEGEKNNMARALLLQSIPESLILQVRNLETTKVVWGAIKKRHMGADRVKEASLQTLMADFDRKKMKETDSIDNFVGRLSELSSKSAVLRETIEEPKHVKKFLNSLPRKKYIHIIAALEQVLDLNKTSFEDILGRLKAYEERIFEEEEEKQDDQGQSKLMYANTETQQYQERYELNRGRGRGGRFQYQRRGRGRYLYQKYGNYRPNIDLSKVVCYRCDKTDHYASSCPDG